jgi:hypothetical protein
MSYAFAVLKLNSLYAIFIMSPFLFGLEGVCDLIYVGGTQPERL